MRLLAVAAVASLVVSCSAPHASHTSAWAGHDPWTAGYAASPPVAVQEAPEAQEVPAAEEPPEDVERGFGHRLLWYIPNRISDVLDIVRARVRVGPGFSIGVRATEFADLFLGSHGSIFVGIPGPRRERSFNWPFGFDSKSGLELSVADATVEGGTNYGWLEFGAGFQIVIVGVDVGVDPWEVVDFALGLLTIDLGGDDI